MKIGIVGLGLIGGSFAKAVKAYTDHEVFAIDKSEQVLQKAQQENIIDGSGNIEECDVVIVCLYPQETVNYLLCTNFKKGALVTDVCGVKRYIADNVSKLLNEKGIRYVGCHPMAGREVSGYESALPDLFFNSSFIIVEDDHTVKEAAKELAEFAKKIGFEKITITTAEEHDKIISYTSQLAHIVSNCYIKSGSAVKSPGFSAGSFQDMTRVAKMNVELWTDLFLKNSEYLINDINELTENLNEIKKQLECDNKEGLQRLLQAGNDRKNNINMKN